MLSRLPPEEFDKKWAKNLRTPFFSLKVKRNETGKARMGVVVGRAVHKSAVRRNFLKRQARVEFSKALLAGTDLLVIFLPAAAKLTKKQLKEKFSEAASGMPQ